ncbi:MAG: hypothetical protein ACM3WV_00770 [Bacillota bacterium]
MDKPHRRQKRHMTVLILCLGLFLTAPGAQAAGEKVKEVALELSFSPGLYGGIRERIRKSIESVSGEIFLDKPVASLRQERAGLTVKMKELLNRSLIGFIVTDLRLEIGGRVVVYAVIEACRPRVGAVCVDIAMESADNPNWLFDRNKNYLQQQLSSFLLGLPVESLEWSGGLLEPILKFTAQQVFPGFEIRTEVVTGETILVRYILTPDSPVLEDVSIEIFTGTMPQTIVNLLRPSIRETLESCKGMPVAYLQFNEGNLTKLVDNQISGFSWMPPLRVRSQIEWRFKEVTELYVNIDSDNFQWQVLGSFSIDGHNEMNFNVKTGWRLQRKWTLLSEFQIDRDAGREFLIGISNHFWEQTDLAWMYDPLENRSEWRLAYFLDRRTRLGLAWNPQPEELVSFIEVKFNPCWSLIMSAFPGHDYRLNLSFNL